MRGARARLPRRRPRTTGIGLCSGPSPAAPGAGRRRSPRRRAADAQRELSGGRSLRARRRPVVGVGPTARTRAFGHGADAQPTVGAHTSTHAPVNNRRRPNDVIKHGRLRAAVQRRCSETYGGAILTHRPSQRPTAGGDDRTVLATSASDGGARTAVTGDDGRTTA